VILKNDEAREMKPIEFTSRHNAGSAEPGMPFLFMVLRK
jgi:hypothetical protein